MLREKERETDRVHDFTPWRVDPGGSGHTLTRPRGFSHAQREPQQSVKRERTGKAF